MKTLGYNMYPSNVFLLLIEKCLVLCEKVGVIIRPRDLQKHTMQGQKVQRLGKINVSRSLIFLYYIFFSDG